MAKYCNIWRNWDDIQDNWASVSSIIDYWGEANGDDYNNFVNVARPGTVECGIASSPMVWQSKHENEVDTISVYL